jgi:hypothetical protein
MKLRRNAFKLFVFLLAGAILNAAFAWGAIAHDQYWMKRKRIFTPSRIGEALTLEERAVWKERPKVFERELTRAWGRSHWAYDREVLSADIGQEIFRMESREIVRAGWPLRSFEGVLWLKTTGNGQVLARVNNGLLHLDSGQVYGGPSFPVRVVPAGLVINTILYAAALWVLFAVPVKVRQFRGWRRIKRGQCASCGYSLRGTPNIEKCPECGAASRVNHR